MVSENSKTEERKRTQAKLRKISTIIKFLFLFLIVVGIPLYLFIFHKDFLTSLKDLDTVSAYLAQYEKVGVFVYLAAQIIQIVISIIPGQELQIVAGFMYGIPIAFLLSLLGAAIGTLIAFYLARWLGQDAVRMLFGDEKTDEYMRRLNSRRAISITFLIYLIPGLPKDIMSYVAGISHMRFRPFLLVSIIGRSPAMLASIAVGKALIEKNYTALGIITGIVLLAFLLGIIFRKRIMAMFDSTYERITKENEKYYEKTHERNRKKAKKTGQEKYIGYERFNKIKPEISTQERIHQYKKRREQRQNKRNDHDKKSGTKGHKNKM
jgi:uncharacterized membrane protein YdjX (TVP38/TMEM64 family)